MSRFSSISIFVVTLLFAGCGFLSEDLPSFGEELQESSLTTDLELLLGSWTLARTNSFSASGRSHTTMAADSDEIHRVEIDADSVYRYLNDTVAWTSAYTLENTVDVPGTIRLEERNPDPQFGVSEDKLVLSTAYVDGPEEVFGRAD